MLCPSLSKSKNSLVFLGHLSLDLCDSFLHSLSSLFEVELGSISEGSSVGGLEGLFSRSEGRILSDLVVDTLVKSIQVISTDVGLDVLGEVSLVLLGIFAFHGSHVFSHVSAHDVVSVSFGIEALGVRVVTRESLLRVGDVESTVSGTLHGSEESSTGGGGSHTDIQESLEGSSVIIQLSDKVLLLTSYGRHDVTSDLSVTYVQVSHAKLGEESSSAEKASAVSSSVVLKADGQTVSRELLGGSVSHHLITDDVGEDDLASDESVGESDNKSVLGGVVLVLVLVNQSTTSVVIGLTLSSSSILDLVSLVVSFVLDNFHERHDGNELDGIS